MRSCFLRAVLLSAAVVGIILAPALPAHAQCSHLGQQVVCPSGISNGSTSLSFTNGSILWQAPAGSTTLSPSAGCCSPFTAPTPTPTAPSATGLTPTTAAGQNALSNAVRTEAIQVQGSGFVPQEAVATLFPYPMPRVRTPSGAVASDRAPLEAERRYQVYRQSQERADAAEREASRAEEEVKLWKDRVDRIRHDYRYDPRYRAENEADLDRLYVQAAQSELAAREAAARGDYKEAERLGWRAEQQRGEAANIEKHASGYWVKNYEQELARAQEKARAARERANAARRDAEETGRRLLQEATREAVDEAERQRTERAQSAQPVQQAQQFTVYFSDPATGSEYLRGYLEAARPVINQSDAANARPPAPRLP